MSFLNDMDWNTPVTGSKYGDEYKTARISSKSLGGFDRWTNAYDRTASAKSKKSKSKEFLSMFKKNFGNKFRANS